MAEMPLYGKSVPKKIKISWPITIYTGKQIIEAVSRTVTEEGLFIYCEQQLPQNETFRIIIIPAPELTVVFRGKLIFSNPGPTHPEIIFPNKSLSFVKVSEEDRYLLHNLIQRMEKKEMETIKEVKVKLELKTDRRIVVKDFSNLHDLRLFMKDFFSLSEVADRRTAQPIFPHIGPERRMRI